ncbi:MAG: hypothetical protein ABI967_16555 [bacterium]
MKKNPRPKFGAFNLRIVLALILCLVGVSLAVISVAKPKPAPTQRGLTLAIERPLAPRPILAAATAALAQKRTLQATTPFVAPPPGTPTFGHPVISGIGGVGFEQDLRLDPSNPNRLYTSAPGTASANTSWIWHSLDGGKTFKWVVGATALEGKVTTCNGGGDTELGVDSAGHLYFNDLTLANFSTARSDDFGATFTCSNAGVPDTAVDRQWYTIDGDPTNGGSIYLANDEIGPGGAMCGSSVGNNVLVMYRSPVGGVGATAGVTFGPANHVTADLSCDEAIMGNNELSPVATTLGQPNGLGGFAVLPTPVKHVFVVHDNATLNKILVGRCFPVAFGAPVPNVSDPSGLNCTDIVVADLGASAKTGGDFPTMAIDKAGNLYAVWEQAPINAGGMINGDTVLKYSYSTDQGNTWAAPILISTSGSPVGTLHTNVFAWMVAGDDGRVDIAWYGTPGAPTFPSNGPDSCPASCDWSLWMVQTLNGHAAVPTFTAPALASEHFIHRGSIQTLMGGQTGDRSLGDFLQIRMGALGEAQVGYADSNSITEAFAPHGMFVRQNGGNGLLAASSPVNISGLTSYNAGSDPSGDGKYEVNGTSSANMPQLDILNSSITKVTTAPCSAGAPCYRVVMQLNNLSLAPTSAQDPDPDLVWLTQWLVPSATDVNGGKNFIVYAESTNGGALQCFSGENAASLVGGGVTLTYPGATALPGPNCQSTLGPNGTITIYVPLSSVNESGAIDARLHEVTASTMTLTQPANSVPSLGGVGGSLFNLIDVAQGYTFDPTVVSAVSRKTHGTAGTFDVDLPLTGTPGIECRQGQGVNSDSHQVVATFIAPVTLQAAAVTSGTGSVLSATPSGNQVVVDLTGVANAQTIAITLFDVNDGTGARNVVIPMSLLLGDTTANAVVNASDVGQTKAQSGLAATAVNFRLDVTVSGDINASDIGLVKSKSGTALPP